MPATVPYFKFSGHETFVCRFPWLPKAVKWIRTNPELFKDENDAMIKLGVGKNMVRSIKYWAESAHIIEHSSFGHQLTAFGERLLGREGHDPYLERIETLWLLHWKIATNAIHPSFYWTQLMNYWHRSEFTVTSALSFLSNSIPLGIKKPSERTLSDGIKVFVNSYVPSRNRKGEVAEDNLDCPLVELNLLRETKAPNESIYTFNLEDKSGVSTTLFAYCLNDFWDTSYLDSDLLDFEKVSVAEGSPGQVFKLPELSVRDRLDQLSLCTKGRIEYLESSSLQQVRRKNEESLSVDLLDACFPL